MKTGNYAGYCDRGYHRNKDAKNSDRLINGLVKCSGVEPEPPVEAEPWMDESDTFWVDQTQNKWLTE